MKGVKARQINKHCRMSACLILALQQLWTRNVGRGVGGSEQNKNPHLGDFWMHALECRGETRSENITRIIMVVVAELVGESGVCLENKTVCALHGVPGNSVLHISPIVDVGLGGSLFFRSLARESHQSIVACL